MSGAVLLGLLALGMVVWLVLRPRGKSESPSAPPDPEGHGVKDENDLSVDELILRYMFEDDESGG